MSCPETYEALQDEIDPELEAILEVAYTVTGDELETIISEFLEEYYEDGGHLSSPGSLG